MDHRNFNEVARVGSVAFGVYTPSRAGARWGRTARGVACVAVDESRGSIINCNSKAILAQEWVTNWVVANRKAAAAVACAVETAKTWAADAAAKTEG